MAKKDLIEKAKTLGLTLSGKETVKQLKALIKTVAPTPVDPTYENEPEERDEMSVKEALSTFKQLRKYVNMDGEFRTGLTKEEMAAGVKMAKQLNVKPKPAKPKKEVPKPAMPVYGEI